MGYNKKTKGVQKELSGRAGRAKGAEKKARQLELLADPRRVALREIFDAIKGHCAVNKKRMKPEETHSLVIEVNRKLGLNENTLFTTGSHIHKICVTNRPYDFDSDGDTHLKLAFALHALKHIDKGLAPSKVQDAVDEKDYGNYWDKYLEFFFGEKEQPTRPSVKNDHTKANKPDQQMSSKFFEVINDHFWEAKKTPKTKEVVVDFIEKGKPASIPYIVANKLLDELDISTPLPYKDKNGGGSSSLYDLVYAEDNFRQIVTVSSFNPGEGKSFFIWNFAKRYSREFLIFVINSFEIENIPSLDTIGRRIIVIIDDKLHGSDADKEALERIYTLFNQSYPESALSFIIVDSYRNLTKCEPLENIRYANFDLVEIPHFSIGREDNKKIFSSLLGLYNLDPALMDRQRHVFLLTASMPLVYRVAGLIGNFTHSISEWQWWVRDKQVAAQGLEKLYFVVAFLNYLGTNLPTEYTSESFLPEDARVRLGELFKSGSTYGEILKEGVSKDGEYPLKYLEPRSKHMSRIYIRLNSSVEKDCASFIDELVRIISNKKATNAHSYIFRKIYDNPLLEQWPLVKKRMERLSPRKLFADLLASDLDFENKEKVKGERVVYLRRSGDLLKAKESLLDIEDQDSYFVKYMRARIEYQMENIDECLRILSELRPSARVTALRNDCFLFSNDYLEKGINYYSRNIRSREAKAYEFENLLKCLRHYSKFNFEVADYYFKNIYEFYKQTDKDTSYLYKILYERAQSYFLWVRTQERREKSLGTDQSALLKGLKIKLIQQIFEEVRELSYSNDKFTLLESEIYAYKNNFPLAIETFLSIKSLTPFNVITNFTLARLYYRYACSQKNDKSLLEKAKLPLERNINLFAERGSGYKRQIQTVALLSKIYSRLGTPEIGLTIVSNFITDKNIEESDASVRNIFSLKRFLSSENEKNSIDDVFPID